MSVLKCCDTGSKLREKVKERLSQKYCFCKKLKRAKRVVRLTEDVLAAHGIEAELLLASLLHLNDQPLERGLHLLFGALLVLHGRLVFEGHSCLCNGRLRGLCGTGIFIFVRLHFETFLPGESQSVFFLTATFAVKTEIKSILQF